MLSDDTVADIDLREEVIDYNIQDRVFFIWKVKSVEEESYYKQSLWVIFPSIYESFPFRLSRAIKFWVPIIASNIPTITNLVWDKIITFNPLSATNLINVLKKFLSSKKEKIDYNKITKEYSIKNTWEKFKKIIYENIYDD
jgi:glycosyltransferase involved in cell wall biosynthesis